ncbi:MAG: hypothetical protein ACE5IO_01035, partial [Thermoplasmata archaeon]
DTDYLVTINADILDYDPAEREFIITVKNVEPVPAEQDQTLILTIAGALVAIVAVSLVVTIMSGKMRRRRKIKKLRREERRREQTKL